MKKDNVVKILASTSVLIVAYFGYTHFAHKTAKPEPAPASLAASDSEIDNLLKRGEAKDQTNSQSTEDAAATDVVAKVDPQVEQKALLESYTNKIQHDNNDADSYYRRAVIYQDTNQYGLAFSDYTQVLRILPNSANAYFNRGVVQAKRKDFVKALEDLTNAIKISPQDPVFYNALGTVYFSLNNLDLAAENYKKSITLDPNFGQGFFNLGTIYEKQNKYDEALVQYDKSIATYATSVGAANASTANVEKTPVDTALNHLLEVYYRRAFVKFQLKSYDAALADINYFIERNTKSVTAYRLRSAIYSKIGNNAGALEDENTAQNLGFEDLLR